MEGLRKNHIFVFLSLIILVSTHSIRISPPPSQDYSNGSAPSFSMEPQLSNAYLNYVPTDTGPPFTFAVSSTYLCWIGSKDGLIECHDKIGFGSGELDHQTLIVNISNNGIPTSVSSSTENHCSITTRAKLVCWQSSVLETLDNNQLGQGPIGANRVDLGGHGAVTFSVGNKQTCAISSDHSVWCFNNSINSQNKKWKRSIHRYVSGRILHDPFGGNIYRKPNQWRGTRKKRKQASQHDSFRSIQM